MFERHHPLHSYLVPSLCHGKPFVLNFLTPCAATPNPTLAGYVHAPLGRPPPRLVRIGAADRQGPSGCGV